MHTNGDEPEDKIVPTYIPERNTLKIPAELLTTETKLISIIASAIPSPQEDQKTTNEIEINEGTGTTAETGAVYDTKDTTDILFPQV